MEARPRRMGTSVQSELSSAAFVWRRRAFPICSRAAATFYLSHPLWPLKQARLPCHTAPPRPLLSITARIFREPSPRIGIRVNCIAPGNVLFPGGSWERHLQDRREAVEKYISQEVPQNVSARRKKLPTWRLSWFLPFQQFCNGQCYIIDGGQTRRVYMSEQTAVTDSSPRQNPVRLFDLTGRVAIVTGGAGLLGYHHGATLAVGGRARRTARSDPRPIRLCAQENSPNSADQSVSAGSDDITSEASLNEMRDDPREIRPYRHTH